MSIARFCVRNVVCAGRETTVVDAAALMRRHHIGNVVVVEQVGERRIPVGIVTDRDLVVEVTAAGLDPKLIKLGDLVLTPVIAVHESTGYAETVSLMSVKGVRSMPVVDSAGALIGIITLDDILRHLAAPLAAISELAGRSRHYETQTRP